MYFLLVNLTVEMINWEINECTLIVSIVPQAALKSDDEKLSHYSSPVTGSSSTLLQNNGKT
jgi:hypothetical protein